MNRRIKTPPWVLSLGAMSAMALIGGLLLHPGCTGDACVGSGNRDVPSSTIECPAGDLCYHGQCFRGCNAGQALVSCMNSDECDSTRPNCITNPQAGGLYCSVCDEGEICVPSLNLCRPINESVPPEEPPVPSPDEPKPNYPLDASFTPTGLEPSNEPKEPPAPPAVPVSHTAFVDVAQQVDYRGANPQSVGSIVVRAFDVRASSQIGYRWYADRQPVQYTRGANTSTVVRECTLRRLEIPAIPPTPADIGAVRIEGDEDLPGSLVGSYEAKFQGTSYQVTRTDTTPPTMTVPLNLMPLSEPSGRKYQLVITGAGLVGVTDGGWPSGGESRFFTPFTLVPTADSQALTQPIVLDATPRDLTFKWTPVETGVDENLQVAVRVFADQFELDCDVRESTPPVDSGTLPTLLDTITVPAGLLQKLRSVAPPGTYPIFFERRRRVLIYAPGKAMGAAPPTTVLTIDAWVRHSLVGALRIE